MTAGAWPATLCGAGRLLGDPGVCHLSSITTPLWQQIHVALRKVSASVYVYKYIWSTMPRFTALLGSHIHECLDNFLVSAGWIPFNAFDQNEKLHCLVPAGALGRAGQQEHIAAPERLPVQHHAHEIHCMCMPIFCVVQKKASKES